MKDSAVIAVDIGGTKVSGAIFNSSEQISNRKSAHINKYGVGFLVKDHLQ